ncbi:MBL fold metallo-hydrolase [uncultured Faecalibaculum sp.]|uniref:MBL fold metallo-hydrolase n=2 Tax=uncultured Faecalibaculum sp. TaxID=1729681 RepID=UPI002606D57B|nr:MBL fold metallo-hydrolase [uncultured Faecalibaculum sp.]
MYELKNIKGNTWIIESPAKVGLVQVTDNRVVLIDSGSDKEAGRKIRQILDRHRWQLEAIYITHSNADHIGGCRFLQDRTGCSIYAPGIECAFTEYPLLEPSFLYGGYPFRELRHKFLMAQPSRCHPLTEADLPAGWSLIRQPGHFFDMVGFRTPDDVVFLADCLSSRQTLEKYGIPFIYDVKAYLETLDMIRNLKAAFFVPAHAPVTEDIRALALFNQQHTEFLLIRVRDILTEPNTFEDLLAALCDEYGIRLDPAQYVLVGSTVRSFLSYLKDAGEAKYWFEGGKMWWQRQGTSLC